MTQPFICVKRKVPVPFYFPFYFLFIFRIAWLAGALLEFIYKTLQLSGEPYITRFMAEEVSQSHWFNISAAKRDLGYKPKLTIAEGLKRLEDWLRLSQAQGTK